MSKLHIIVMLFFIASASCNNADGSANEEDSDSKEKQFYPIAGFIQSQLNYLDAAPLAIIHYTTVNNITDTSIQEKNDFRNSIGKEFIQSDISGDEQKKKYHETSFIDATLGVITLSYAPRKGEDDLAVSKIDVLLNQENSAVKTIYIEKVTKAADSTVLKKMLWNADKSCQVISIIEKNNQPYKTIQERFVWDETF